MTTTPNTDALHPEINRRLNALLLEVDASIVDDIRQALLTYQPYTRTSAPSASVAVGEDVTRYKATLHRVNFIANTWKQNGCGSPKSALRDIASLTSYDKKSGKLITSLPRNEDVQQPCWPNVEFEQTPDDSGCALKIDDPYRGPEQQGWHPISIEPKEAGRDWIIARFITRGDCAWVKLKRTPSREGYKPMEYATHWRYVNDIDAPTINSDWRRKAAQQISELITELNNSIDGGEECGGSDSMISDFIRKAIQVQNCIYLATPTHPRMTEEELAKELCGNYFDAKIKNTVPVGNPTRNGFVKSKWQEWLPEARALISRLPHIVKHDLREKGE